MTRRKLITLLGGLLALPVAQPFVARADRTRRIGLLINLAPTTRRVRTV